MGISVTTPKDERLGALRNLVPFLALVVFEGVMEVPGSASMFNTSNINQI